jgi:hypothetical protein
MSASLPHPAELSASNSVITFASEDGRVFLRSVTDRATGKVVLKGRREVPLWRMVAGAGGTDVASSSEFAGKLQQREGGLEILWDDVELDGHPCRVAMNVSGDASGLTRMDLHLTPDDSFTVWDVHFPIIGPLDGGTLHTTYGYGKAIPLGEGVKYSGGYPGHHCTMQFIAWNPGPCNLYLGAHDPRASAKTMELLPDDGPSMGCRLPVPGRCRPLDGFTMPYPSLVGTIPGDWYDLARFYRKWALGQEWSRAGPVARREIPGRIRDAVIWLQAAGDPEEVVPKALEFNSYFGVPMAMHWYSWHEIPFDDHYPEYLPPKKGFKEAVARLSSAGIGVMPYINGRLWDPATESWRKENALAAASKDENLDKYVEVYASKVPLSPMCPTTGLWQRKIASIVTTLAREYGVQGIYIDQIGAAAPKLCHDESHGHPIGGGSWWVDGYRKLLDRVRREVREVDPEFFVTTESNAEPWNDRLDGVLMCNTTEGELVPIYPAVYHDMIPAFGAYIFGSDLEDGWAFRVKVSQMFLWGTQLGWLGPAILDPKFSASAEYLRELARIRMACPDYLGAGTFLRPPEIENRVKRVRASWELWRRKWELDVPVAQATAWQAPDGSLGLVACNMGDGREELEISLSLEDPGWRDLKPDGLRSSGMSKADPRIRGKRLHLNLELDSRSAICLSSRPER